MPEFCHLHNHTQYSLLDGATDITAMMEKAAADGQKGVALTDHGNMFGAFKFVAEANKRGVKPIVGCEFYLVDDRHKQTFVKSKGEKDIRYHQLLLAKNEKGYQNLSKLCSLGFIEGAYGKFPRIDKELVLEYHEGLIATSCCIGAEIPQTILRGDNEKAESLLRWWIDLFGDDFYIELQRHKGMESIDDTGMSQEDVNQVLIGFAKKYNVKLIATNDAHYLEEDDWKPHDILLCVNTNSNISAEKRFKFPSSDFYFKTQDEMTRLFSDVEDAIANTMEIYDKITPPQLERDILLPNFPLPSGFKDQAEYLKHLVYEGAKRRYGEISEKVRERLDLELGIISQMGFAGYFLIVQDFIKAAREMGVSVGPGRGSAAGSAVAYCLTITNIDPIGYNLLFERFLNPERISMPDIDIDFDDEGRQKVIDWVVDKYGKNQVAQIITFGTMAARMSIRDVGRVMSLPLDQTDSLAKRVPSRPGTTLRNLFKPIKELGATYSSDEISNIKELQAVEAAKDLEGETLRLARRIEGSVRNTGIHAAGVIIAPDDITKYIPVCTAKDADLYVTQFDGSVVEDAGMLKMDFLGLKTLSIIKEAIENIARRHGESARFHPDDIPLDDEKTYELFQRGEMIGVFQFESEGMRKYLKELKPTTIEDLIAMNALYRPGPMDYIPSFIARKHGKEDIEYPHEWLEDILKPTYGIMVYQEQIMQTAQIMADYSLGKADMLRRAMGKKKVKEMARHEKIFIDGAVEKGVSEAKAKKIFDVMAKFAEYGFNRSHSAAYSVLAFQTAYLKQHYPAEFMAAVLTYNRSDVTKLNFFLRECKRMHIPVLGPDINESQRVFTVNEEGAIRFGLTALKGVGEGPVEAILEERSNEPFTSIFDMTRRLNLRSVNKKAMESLVYGGALDAFGLKRAQYFAPTKSFDTLIEHALKFGNKYQKQAEQGQNSLFGDINEYLSLEEPELPECEDWPLVEKLTREKDVTGIYISGHPLDDFKMEIDNFTTIPLDQVENAKNRQLSLAGLIVKAEHRITQRGDGWGRVTIQDYHGTLEFALWRENYKKYKDLCEVGEAIYIEGMYKKNYRGDRYEFEVTDMRMLGSISEDKTKSITLRLPLEKVDEKLVQELENMCKKHKGKHLLKMLLVDENDELSITAISGSRKITVDHQFVDEIHDMGLSYKIN
ncbi:MAG: DNA polymerase III subunit alpha [Saprospiraceae bacterium]|nr:DNA polymerase III subunit alpha [Saprospiraceae bacterium]